MAELSEGAKEGLESLARAEAERDSEKLNLTAEKAMVGMSTDEKAALAEGARYSRMSVGEFFYWKNRT